MGVDAIVIGKKRKDNSRRMESKWWRNSLTRGFTSAIASMKGRISGFAVTVDPFGRGAVMEALRAVTMLGWSL